MKRFTLVILVLCCNFVNAHEYSQTINEYVKKQSPPPPQLSNYEFIVHKSTQIMNIFKDGQEIGMHKVIIGQHSRPTPIMETSFDIIRINPVWVVPRHKVAGDLIRKFQSKKNPISYINFMKYYFVDYETDSLVDPHTINWNEMTAKTLPFRIKQKPGVNNVLGNVVFMLEVNGIQMHSTSTPELFNRTNRYFSSGCIRVEGIDQLAATLLHKTEEQYRTLLSTSENICFKIPNKVVVKVVAE